MSVLYLLDVVISEVAVLAKAARMMGLIFMLTFGGILEITLSVVACVTHELGTTFAIHVLAHLHVAEVFQDLSNKFGALCLQIYFI